MSNRNISTVAAALAMLLVAAASMADKAATERGAELLVPFKGELKQALVAGMKEGPVNAISVCKTEAREIADSLSIDGVRMGRTSHRLRNSENVAPGWVSPVLDGYLADSSDRSPKVVKLPDDRMGYVEPIALQPLCLACHGASLVPEVAAHIAGMYPDDQATGFAVGDLRGVFWVEYPDPRQVTSRSQVTQ
jgi:hypothetical protein